MRVQALPVLDVLDVEEDGERVLLLDERALVLSPIASLVHELLTPRGASNESALPWRQVEDLLAELALLVPLPPEPEVALTALLADLATQGVVRVTPDG